MVVVMVMLMLLVIMVMAAATLVIMMMVMMLMLFLKHFLLQRYRMLHNLYQFLSVKILDRSCDDGCIFIQAAKKLQGLLNFLLSCDICTAHDDGACILDLIVKELTEVLHVHLAFLGINNSCIAVQFDVNLILNTLYSFDNVRKFTNSGWLDEDSVRVVFGNNFFQGSTEISYQRAADTSGVHLTDLNSCLFQEAAVNTDLTKLVLDQHDLLTLKSVFQKFFNQSCFSGAKETGDNINFYHFVYTPFNVV